MGPRFCEEMSRAQMVFAARQSGSTLSGTLRSGAFEPIPVSGTVSPDTSVTLTGIGAIQFSDSPADLSLTGTNPLTADECVVCAAFDPI